MNNWGWFVSNWSWLVSNWSWFVGWGWLVNHWHWMVNSSWGRMVDWCWFGVDWSMYSNMGWSMDGSAVLLSSIGVVDVLWGSMRLAGDHSSIRSVRLVHRMAHSWSIAVLDDLVVGLVSSSSDQEGRGSNKSLKSREFENEFVFWSILAGI